MTQIMLAIALGAAFGAALGAGLGATRWEPASTCGKTMGGIGARTPRGSGRGASCPQRAWASMSSSHTTRRSSPPADR